MPGTASRLVYRAVMRQYRMFCGSVDLATPPAQRCRCRSKRHVPRSYPPRGPGEERRRTLASGRDRAGLTIIESNVPAFPFQRSLHDSHHPPRPVDLVATFPELAPQARTTTRPHPRPGVPAPQDSSIGGPLLWPVSEPRPHCRKGQHQAAGPADIVGGRQAAATPTTGSHMRTKPPISRGGAVRGGPSMPTRICISDDAALIIRVCPTSHDQPRRRADRRRGSERRCGHRAPASPHRAIPLSGKSEGVRQSGEIPASVATLPAIDPSAFLELRGLPSHRRRLRVWVAYCSSPSS